MKVRTDLSDASILEFHTETKQPYMTDDEGNYIIILNKSSGIFHISEDCYSASIIKDENREIVKVNDFAQALDRGLKPCGVCAKKYITEEPHD